eukprot:CAMPEP_0119367572 /NCGR_PEP_ID=MMETSP1334-20130426/14353_1 /TAXON_ID=127549 /ORGANISM="Calcidiscus leptoporus, Strain RCC1130" /LENGTH=160 /DNA_ID=CAMNT_0007384011 /DNA_START=304 /DNA_END=784 /DNA_ORIENTATION=-
MMIGVPPPRGGKIAWVVHKSALALPVISQCERREAEAQQDCGAEARRFASARWGLDLSDVRSARDHLLQRLHVRLPLQLLDLYVETRELTPPRRTEGVTVFLRAYEKIVRQCRLQCSAGGDEESSAGGDEANMSVPTVVARHMQARLASFTMYRVYEAQD